MQSNNSYPSSLLPLTCYSHLTPQGLYLCGRDISTTGLAGDIQGGWMAANAVLGYDAKDLLGGRNIATDLQKMKR